VGEKITGRPVVELLQLMQAGLAFTAVTVVVATAPVAIMTGEEVPDITPLIENIHSDTTEDS